ncbi:exopolysaccharide biosynthesis protein [Christensenellaceae bacterium]|nr:exopolysaccharide biosynthesis protein [Christensenellaceae bacterium]BDF60617.1 exopolysaccharide biosynthesis protein [Christensenellaceae bacterium]
MNRLLLGNTDNLERKIYLWNIIGSMANALASVILLFVVTRVLGANDAGIFTLANSTALMMLTIGFYEMRAFQATDVKGVYSFSDYLMSRFVTVAAMVAASFFFVFAGGYTHEKAAVMLLLCIYKVFDALEDVFHGLYQQQGRLDVAGRSLSLRVLLSTAAFVIVLLATRSLIGSCVAAIIAAAAGFMLFNLTIFRHFYGGAFHWNKKAVFTLLWVCLPMFLGSFMLVYINNAPKYAIDTYLSFENNDYQAYFGYLFMPSFVINLFSTFIFRPMVTPMAQAWADHDRSRLTRIIGKLLAAIVCLTIAGVAVGYFFGVPILSWFYGIDLSSYRAELLILVLGGGCNAVVTLMFYGITVLRKQKLLVVGYGATLVLALVISNILVSSYGLMGASAAFLISMAVLALLFFIIFIVCYKKESRKMDLLGAQ